MYSRHYLHCEWLTMKGTMPCGFERVIIRVLMASEIFEENTEFALNLFFLFIRHDKSHSLTFTEFYLRWFGRKKKRNQKRTKTISLFSFLLSHHTYTRLSAHPHTSARRHTHTHIRLHMHVCVCVYKGKWTIDCCWYHCLIWLLFGCIHGWDFRRGHRVCFLSCHNVGHYVPAVSRTLGDVATDFTGRW